MDIDRILEKPDLLVQVAERAGAKLKRSGSTWRGPCPLPSGGGDNPTAFVVYAGSDGRQRWHCHPVRPGPGTHCGGGDAIDFVRRWRQLPDDAAGFVEAVRLLADLAGVPLADVGLDARPARPRRHLLRVAADYYAGRLWSPAGQPGLDYARVRRWTDETIRELGLGYADGRLLAYLREQDADLRLAVDAGLVAERPDGSLADAIPSGYLVYAHRTPGGRGRVTYLSGRAVGTDDPARKARNLSAPRQLP